MTAVYSTPFAVYTSTMPRPLTALLLLASAPFARAADTLKPFLEAHCVDCHGSEVQKAKFRLDTLKPDFAAPETAESWIKVLDKLAAGAMPPASEPKPPANDVKAVTAYLSTQLHDASLADQQRNGRVVLRRLNRTEYVNTLHDLLDVPVDVDELLPDDNVAFGFDNVSTALDLSSAHFLRYQDAADKVLSFAVPYRQPKLIKERHTGQQIVDKGLGGNAKKWVQVADGAVTMFARPARYMSIFSYPYGILPGTYRLKFSISAVNTQGKTMPVGFVRVREEARDEGETLGCFDAPPDKPAEFTQEFYLRGRERINLVGWTMPGENEFNNKHKDGLPADYKGPGLTVQFVELEGPLEPFPGVGYKRLFGDLPLKPVSLANAERDKKPLPKIRDTRSDEEWKRDPLTPVSTDPVADSERLLKNFLPLAFRRPVTVETVKYFQKFALDRLDKGYSFGEAMVTAYKAALCSPHFLLLEEHPGALDDDALAARLSYFVWRSLPDAELTALARSGTLHTPAILHAQLDRLLNDPKAQRFVADFAGQWLDLRKLNATSPDPQLYAEFDHYLLWAMPLETTLFFDEIVRKNLPVTQFVDSAWTFVNERLAQHYGIKDICGSALRRVALTPDLHRGGVLTQASVLKVTADGTRTSPILRGKWVLERIVGTPPPPPPPDVPAIEPDIRGAVTIRQQLAKHRTTAACNACHKFIDPPGFALETYDVIGGWRDFYRVSKYSKTKVELANYPGQIVGKGLPVEKGDSTPDGRAFKDIEDYKKILLEDPVQLTRNLIRKLTIYSTGAGIQFADREVIERLVAKVHAQGDGVRTMLHAIVETRVFLNK
jgi:mono/diheme cytochrome c family protein